MNEVIISEIVRLKSEIDDLWDLANQSGTPTWETSGKTRDLHDRSDLDYKLGLTGSRFIRYGWRGAFRPWMDSFGIRGNLLKSLGLPGGGLVGGFLGGLYGGLVTLALNGITKLFRKKRSQLIAAQAPEKVRYIFEDISQPSYQGESESESIRGKSGRFLSRERSTRSESLERQMRRGVVGL